MHALAAHTTVSTPVVAAALALTTTAFYTTSCIAHLVRCSRQHWLGTIGCSRRVITVVLLLPTTDVLSC
jgi:hypothetical protein